MNFLPINIDIEGKRILIIGGGRVGLHKAKILNRFTQEATVISPKFEEEFHTLPFKLKEKSYDKKDLEGVFLVYVCTENSELNRQIKQDAQEMRILCSVCDNPQLCDFTSPAIFKKDDILIAVSSNATNVHKSMSIRDAIKENWDYLLKKLQSPHTLYTKRM